MHYKQATKVVLVFINSKTFLLVLKCIFWSFIIIFTEILIIFKKYLNDEFNVTNSDGLQLKISIHWANNTGLQKKTFGQRQE